MPKRKSIVSDEHPVKKQNCEKNIIKNFEKEALLIQSAFLLKCPPDFFNFFSFCCDTSPDSPLLALQNDLGIKLVGPFEILTNPAIVLDGDDLTNCYRYLHDPPEFVTVMISEPPNKFHIGYFRDNYDDEPCFLASSDPSTSGKLYIFAVDIFSAAEKLFRRNKNTEKCSIFLKLRNYAATNSITMNQKAAVTRNTVCKTLNGLGLKVNLQDDIGYRPVPMDNQKLVDLLNKIASSLDDTTKLKHQAKLDDLITLIQFANDEGDFGEGLELGLDLLAFHPTENLEGAQYFNKMISHLLSTGYQLAGLPKFADVIRKHMQNRSTEPVCIGETLLR